MRFRTQVVDRTKMLVTIRQASGVVFPFIKPSTIALWIAQGIFRPVQHSRGTVGPGRGSKLDFWDLVFIGVLHSLFASGVRFKHLLFRGRSFESFRIGLQRPLPEGVLEEIGGQTMPWPTYVGGPHFRRIAEWDYVDTLADRQVQAYIEKYLCDVVVSVQLLRPKDVHQEGERVQLIYGDGPGGPSAENVSKIDFAPLRDKACYTDHIGASRPYERHVFMNCQYWGHFVEDRLSDLI
ncbi:MAG: hypothetical protein WBG50_26225 [Desulfomonilaceae bacterium]